MIAYVLAHARDVWQATGQHLALAATSLLIAFAIALPCGIAAARVRRLGAPLLSLLGAIYTIPSMALLGVLVIVEGLGFWTAVTALAAYAQMILVRNIVAGLRGIDPSIREAARGLGMNAWQMLWLVERPLAMPLVIAGIRIAAVSIIGIGSVAAWAGAGGLGTLIFAGIDQGNYAKALTGAVAAIALAVLTDTLLRAVERRYRRHVGPAAA